MRTASQVHGTFSSFIISHRKWQSVSHFSLFEFYCRVITEYSGFAPGSKNVHRKAATQHCPELESDPSVCSFFSLCILSRQCASLLEIVNRQRKDAAGHRSDLGRRVVQGELGVM
jgi:hypothetical protein